jgi:hypothetical protein
MTDNTARSPQQATSSTLTLTGVILLVGYALMRPFDFFPVLRGIPFLYIFFGIAVIGFLADLGRGTNRWARAPHLPWVITLVLWDFLTAVIQAPATLGGLYIGLLVPMSLYFIVSHGLARFSELARLGRVFLLCTIAVSAVCTYQGLQPFRCVEFEPNPPPDVEEGNATDQPCSTTQECYEAASDPEMDYSCERIGLADIATVGNGRVRYVGVLNGPNEAALAVVAGVPLAVAWRQSRRGLKRWLALGVVIALAVSTVIMSQSRGALLVLLVTAVVYFVARYRWKGLLVAALVAAPLMLFGSSATERVDAEESTGERLAAQEMGIQMFLSNPALGVGFGQYKEHFRLTAHNSFVYAPAETGLLGMTAWCMVFWISVKLSYYGIKRSDPDTEARRWSTALFASLVGMAVGVAFLTMNYHVVLWTLFGMAGANHRCLQREHPDFVVRFGWKDVVGVTLGNLAFLFAVHVYAITHG